MASGDMALRQRQRRQAERVRLLAHDRRQTRRPGGRARHGRCHEAHQARRQQRACHARALRADRGLRDVKEGLGPAGACEHSALAANAVLVSANFKQPTTSASPGLVVL